GTWGEVQLGGILEQILAPSQYAANVRIKPNSNEVVEFAVKLPGRNNNDRECIWLPIDSKFPQEDYLRLQEAAELGN
ncbi:DNA recombination protein RmuC, partial [Escherichia coli]|nr:DNA recombination protein RmuC [Escherichia coli]